MYLQAGPVSRGQVGSSPEALASPPQVPQAHPPPPGSPVTPCGNEVSPNEAPRFLSVPLEAGRPGAVSGSQSLAPSGTCRCTDRGTQPELRSGWLSRPSPPLHRWPRIRDSLQNQGVVWLGQVCVVGGGECSTASWEGGVVGLVATNTLEGGDGQLLPGGLGSSALARTAPGCGFSAKLGLWAGHTLP